MSGVRGHVAPGYEAAADAFEATLDGSTGGAAFAAFAGGELVVDLWGGDFDEDTLVLVFSGTKGLVAASMLRLVKRGRLELDAPVVRYWPEFAGDGRERVLVRHVLAHTAGLPGLRASFTVDEALDAQAMAARLARETPWWPPGERLAYHALTFGWLCDALIRRVDGRSAGRFFAEEFADPLGLELWIGLPAELDGRVVALTRAPTYGITGTGPLLDAVYGELTRAFRWNEPQFRRKEIAAGSGIGTARSIARFYASLDPRLAQPELSRGLCAVTGRPYAYGGGFELQTELMRFGPVPDAFGHTGSGGSTHGLWPSQRIAFSYAMSELRAEAEDERGPSILDALAQSARSRARPKGAQKSRPRT